MKVAVVYWSGTGNTETLAKSVANGAKESGSKVDVIEAASFGPGDMPKYDRFAFGCPAMGSEVLEEDTFEPMFESIESSLKDKKIVLFGSYGWGDGEWMRSWEERAKADGTDVLDTLIANGEPDDIALSDAEKLGKLIAG